MEGRRFGGNLLKWTEDWLNDRSKGRDKKDKGDKLGAGGVGVILIRKKLTRKM